MRHLLLVTGSGLVVYNRSFSGALPNASMVGSLIRAIVQQFQLGFGAAPRHTFSFERGGLTVTAWSALDSRSGFPRGLASFDDELEETWLPRGREYGDVGSPGGALSADEEEEEEQPQPRSKIVSPDNAEELYCIVMWPSGMVPAGAHRLGAAIAAAFADEFADLLSRIGHSTAAFRVFDYRIAALVRECVRDELQRLAHAVPGIKAVTLTMDDGLTETAMPPRDGRGANGAGSRIAAESELREAPSGMGAEADGAAASFRMGTAPYDEVNVLTTLRPLTSAAADLLALLHDVPVAVSLSMRRLDASTGGTDASADSTLPVRMHVVRGEGYTVVAVTADTVHEASLTGTTQYAALVQACDALRIVSGMPEHAMAAVSQHSGVPVMRVGLSTAAV